MHLLHLAFSIPGALLALALASMCIFGLFTYPTPETYAGSKAQSSQGTNVYCNPTIASPPDWVQIGEPSNAEFSDKNMFDKATNLQSQAEEYVALLPDPGNLPLDFNRVSTDAGQQAMLASKNASPQPTKMQYLVVFPLNVAAGQTTYPDARMFNAFVESMSPVIKANKIISSKASLKITGPITDIEGS